MAVADGQWHNVAIKQVKTLNTEVAALDVKVIFLLNVKKSFELNSLVLGLILYCKSDNVYWK